MDVRYTRVKMSTPAQITELETPVGPCLPEALVSSTALLLAQVGVTIKMRVMDELDCGGYEYAVLELLGEGAQETQAAIADGLGVDRSQLVGVLDSLERDGFIERKRDPHDRRRHAVSITADGKRQLLKLRSAVREFEESILEPLDEKTRKALHEALYRVAGNLDPRFIRPA
jgi:DNA-binding MarR family transcriptional regulator